MKMLLAVDPECLVLAEVNPKNVNMGCRVAWEPSAAFFGPAYSFSRTVASAGFFQGPPKSGLFWPTQRISRQCAGNSVAGAL